MEIEGGSIYETLVRGDIPDEIAKPAAIGGGMIIGIIEAAQIGRLMKYIPGGKHFTKKALTKTLVKNPKLLKKLAKIGGLALKDLAVEIGEEVSQEITTIGSEVIPHVIKSLTDEVKYGGPTLREAGARVAETAIEMLKAMPLLILPGASVQTANAVGSSAKAGLRNELETAIGG